MYETRCGRLYSEQIALQESCHACFHSWRISSREAGIRCMLYVLEKIGLPEGPDSTRLRMCSCFSDAGCPMFCRWNQAHKSSGTNFQGLPSKIDTLKEEMDEAGNKVELCKVRDFPDK